MKKNMIIVGAGLAGLSAALQAVKEGCSGRRINFAAGQATPLADKAGDVSPPP